MGRGRNVALLYQPRGGLNIAGGVSRHLQAHLQAPRFMAAAGDKGRFAWGGRAHAGFLVVQPRLGVHGAIAAAFARPEPVSTIHY